MKRLIIGCILLTSYVSNAQQWQWAKQIGSGYQFYGERANSVVSDGTNVYLIGSYGGVLNLPNNTLYSNGNNDIFIAKFDAAGNNVWARTIGGSYMQPDHLENGNGVFDPVNNCLYISGNVIGFVNFGNGISLNGFPNSEDAFVAKYDLNGNCLWAKGIGSVGRDNAYCFAQPDGNVLLAGKLAINGFAGTTAIDSGGFFARYDTNGNLLWAENKFFGPEQYEINIAFIGSDIVMGGFFNITNAIIDTASLNLIGNINGYLTRMDSQGNVKWIHTFGGGGVNGVSGVSIDALDNIYITGGFQDSLLLNGVNLYNNGRDFFIAKFNSNGVVDWGKQLNATGATAAGSSICSDLDGNCYVSGAFSDSASFGTFNVNTSNTYDMFISRFNNNGDCLGVKHFGRASNFSSVVDNSGSVYCAGVFFNTVTIGSTSMTSLLGQDIYLTKIDAITGIGGVEGRMANNQLLIYANPNQGKCNITVPDEFVNEKNLTLSIYDNTGKLIQQKTLEMNEGKIKVNLEQEAKGVYNVTLASKKKSYSGKIVFE